MMRPSRLGFSLGLALFMLGCPPLWPQGTVAPHDNWVIDAAAPGSGVALAWLTGAQPGNPLEGTPGSVAIPARTATSTVAVQNQGGQPLRLLLDAIVGDAGSYQQCRSLSFICDVRGTGTAEFVFEPYGPTTTRLTARCHNLLAGIPQVRQFVVSGTNGVLFAAAASPTSGQAISSDVVYGSTHVADSATGNDFDLPGIHYQAGMLANDGNKVFSFDGMEYQKHPSELSSITPFGFITEFVFFTIDHTLGSPPGPRARLATDAAGGLGVLGFEYDFECFDVVATEDLDPDIGLVGTVASVTFAPSVIGTANSGHDDQYGDGNDSRRRAVHGWVYIRDLATDDFQGFRLDQNDVGLAPYGGDAHATLDADPRH